MYYRVEILIDDIENPSRILKKAINIETGEVQYFADVGIQTHKGVPVKAMKIKFDAATDVEAFERYNAAAEAEFQKIMGQIAVPQKGIYVPTH